MSKFNIIFLLIFSSSTYAGVLTVDKSNLLEDSIDISSEITIGDCTTIGNSTSCDGDTIETVKFKVLKNNKKINLVGKGYEYLSDDLFDVMLSPIQKVCKIERIDQYGNVERVDGYKELSVSLLMFYKNGSIDSYKRSERTVSPCVE